MAALVAAIHVFLAEGKSWVAGIKPAMTQDDGEGRRRSRLATVLQSRQLAHLAASRRTEGNSGQKSHCAPLEAQAESRPIGHGQRAKGGAMTAHQIMRNALHRPVAIAIGLVLAVLAAPASA